jgi:hypothetical protein
MENGRLSDNYLKSIDDCFCKTKKIIIFQNKNQFVNCKAHSRVPTHGH